MTDFGFYLVMTDPKVGYERCAEAAVHTGVKIIQLRMKNAPRDAILETARRVRAVTRGTGTAFILNDDPELAVACEADGVHLGQDDMPLPEARRRYPALRLFGLSTHTLAQARAAIPLQPDYIGVGPVYATPTKAIPDPTLGVEAAAEMIRAVPFPAVAIGGLDVETLPSILKTGAKNFAVVRAVCASDDPAAAIRRIQALAASFREA